MPTTPIAKLLLVGVTSLLLAACSQESSSFDSNETRSTSEPSATPEPTPALACTPPPHADASAKFADFAGLWYAHGSCLRIDGDGAGHMLWRAGRECDGSGAPCTRVTEEGVDYDTGLASFTLTLLDGERASGRVDRSNDPDFPVGSRITLTHPDKRHVVIKGVPHPDGGTFDWQFCGEDADDCGA